MIKKLNLEKKDKGKFLGEHFLYEIQKLNTIYERLIQLKRIGDREGEMIFLEAFLLHARNLFYFFYEDRNPKSKEDDVYASDFAKNWENLKLEKTEEIKSFEERMNKELTHLTTSRIYGNPPEKYWILQPILSHFNQLTKIFLENLPKNINLIINNWSYDFCFKLLLLDPRKLTFSILNP